MATPRSRHSLRPKGSGLPPRCVCPSPSPLTLNQAEDVVGVHYQVLFTFHLHLGPGVLGQHHHVPGAHLHLVGVANRDDLGRLRLLPGRVRQETIPLTVCSSLSIILTKALAPSGFNFICFPPVWLR
jgi:hypothetical protein